MKHNPLLILSVSGVFFFSACQTSDKNAISTSHESHELEGNSAPNTEIVKVEPTHPLTETYDVNAFTLPIEIPYYKESDTTQKMHYWEKIHLVGWSNNGDISYYKEPSQLGMADEYFLEFFIDNGMDKKTLFQWKKPLQLDSKNLETTIGIYQDRFIDQLKQQDIKPLKTLNFVMNKRLVLGNNVYEIQHKFESGSYDRLWIVKNGKDTTLVYEKPHTLPEPWGKNSSKVQGYFTSQNNTHLGILLEEEHLGIEGITLYKPNIIVYAIE